MSKTRKRERGYTLIELMVVVAIVGVLAALGTYGVRKYVLSAKTAEAVEIINSIRAAQEAYKDETFGYLHVSDMTSYYPFQSKGDLSLNKKVQWDAGASGEKAKWDQLGVRSSAPVEFGYACSAGKGNGVPPYGSIGTTRDLNYPSAATDWYVVRAAGDRAGGPSASPKVYAIFVGSNFTDAIYGENETE